jgi:hypothetical protein
MDDSIRNSTERHPESGSNPPTDGQLPEAAGPNEAASTETPGSASPAMPKRKYTRKAKPRLPENPSESAPSPERNGQPPEVASTEADEWDLEALKVSQDYADGLGVEQAVTDVPVSKPLKSQWVRTHPDEAYRIETYILELEEEREIYLVAPSLHAALKTEPTVSRRLLISTITKLGRLFIWPIKLPASDGKSNIWNETALEAARRASSSWVRIAADMAFGTYRVWEAKAALGDPKWPSLSFKEILKIAFQERRISSLDHPVVKRLREGG